VRTFALYLAPRVQCAILGLEVEDSISGSASESDSVHSDESDAVGNLIQRAQISSRPASPSDVNPSAPQTPLAWFHSPPATQIGVYKAIFPLKLEPASYVDELRSMQTGGGSGGRKWAMFMTAGGHFAGVIVRVSKSDVEEEKSKTAKQKRLKIPRLDTEVLLHKTFHRYTSMCDLCCFGSWVLIYRSPSEAGRFSIRQR
jgi:Bacteroidetes VLRF1 release factor